MLLVIGLGNPGKKYEHTRHNIGFLAMNHFLQDQEQIKCQHKFGGQICEFNFFAFENKNKAIKAGFLKPETFMNESGRAVIDAVNFYKINIETELLIIHDEVDLAFGYTKLVFDSRPAGHNGVKSIIKTLGTQKFHRLRIGIETRESKAVPPTDAFVLANFTQNELEALKTQVFPETDKYIAQFLVKEK